MARIHREIKLKLHNRFDIIRKNVVTGEEEQVAYAENIILNGAWQDILNLSVYSSVSDNPDQGAWFYRIYYGTGSGTLDASRTTLFSYLGNKVAETAVRNWDFAGRWCSLQRRITILETEHNGETFREVGLYSYMDHLCTHALLKDMEGNPTSILKTDTDILYIYGTVYLLLPPYTDENADVAFYESGPDYNPIMAALTGQRIVCEENSGSFADMEFRLTPRLITFFKGEPPSCWSNNWNTAGISDAKGLTLTVTRDLPTKKVTMYYRLPAALGNGAVGIKSAALHTDSVYYDRDFIILRWPSATHTQNMIVEQIGTGDGSNDDFATAFPFVKSSPAAVIKVDGTPVAASVATGLPNQKDIREYMKVLGATGTGQKFQACNFPYSQTDGTVIVENPFYATHGIDTMVVSYVTIYKSDNLADWTQVFTTTGTGQTYTVDAGDKQSRYWKFVETSYNFSVDQMNCNALDSFKNVTTTSPPAMGAVVTAEYYTDVVAKDINHVVDVTVEMTVAEYVPEEYY